MTDRDRERLSVEAARGRTVAEAMLARPKTLPAASTVADVRRLLERSTIRTVLLVEGTAFRGSIERGDLPADAPDEAPALAYAGPHEAIGPEAPVELALERLARRREQRLVVLDADGETLRGLLCLTGEGGFCVGP